jgi:hypothetical protein
MTKITPTKQDDAELEINISSDQIEDVSPFLPEDYSNYKVVP